QCVMQLSRAIRRLLPSARLYLVVTKGDINPRQERTGAFDEIIHLGGLKLKMQAQLCESIFQTMDLVINTHSQAAYESILHRRKRNRHNRPGAYVSYLHVFDEDKGRLVGYPVEAVRLEHGCDGFAVISDQLRGFLINEGIEPARIRTVRNAAVVRPASRGRAMEIAEEKASRLARGERPLRLLFAGRADYQKGIARLNRMADLLAQRQVPFHLSFVGGARLDGEQIRLP